MQHPLGPLAPLAAYRQFILCRLEPLANGKMAKLPVDYRTLQKCDAHSPQVWTDYDTAAGIARALGENYRIGFVLRNDDPFAVVDIDDCRQPDGKWSPLALALCRQLPGSVAELSQSGKGLHLWLRRKAMPAHVQKNIGLHIECYSKSGRFVCLGALDGSQANGTMVDDCTAIDSVIDEFFPPRERVAATTAGDGPRPEWRGPESDEDLLRRALQSKSAANVFGTRASFADLWHAEESVLSKAYPPDAGSSEPYDRSSADAALAAHVAFSTGCHRSRMDRLMRASGLSRDKYERPDYLQRTIANACSLQRDVLIDAPAAPVASVADVLAQIRQLTTPEDVAAKWVALAVPLSKADAEQVIDAVERWAFAGRQALKATLAAARSAEATRQQREALAKRAGTRMMIRHRPEACSEQAHEIEAAIVAAAAPGEYVAFAGALAHVTTKSLPDMHLVDNPDEAPPPVPQIEPMDEVAVRQRAENVAVFYEVQASGREKLIAFPPLIIDVLIRKKVHAAPVVNGLVTHPIVLRGGEILASEGLHSSGLFLSGVAVADARPYRQGEAVAALARLSQPFLEGFEFASPLDADVALAGLFTGIERKLLDSAPGLAVLAAAQSSGKTTVARRIHVILTGRDMPVATFPIGDEAEASKRILSALLRSPAMICFDNVPDGFNFSSSALSAAMTSSTIEQRVLGISRDASAPTNVLFALTGNNLTLGVDEVTRWLVCRLAPRVARPERRVFAHPDVVQHALAIRAQVLRDVVGIIAGYLAAAMPLPTASRFPAWDRLVRQPLMWAGASDVTQVFSTNSENSKTLRAHHTVVWALLGLFGNREFRSSELYGAATAGTQQFREPLREALESLDPKRVNSGRAMADTLDRFKGKVAEVDGREVRVESRYDSHSKASLYRVVICG